MSKPKKPADIDVPDDVTADPEMDLGDGPDLESGLDIGEEEDGSDDLAPAPPRDEILEPGMPSEPKMPVAVSGFIEYSAPDRERWRCERPVTLFEDFSILGADAELVIRMEEWHSVMSSQGGTTWTMLRRWYRCAPLTGEISPDDLKEWTRDTLSKKLGISEEKLAKALEETVEFWGRVQLEKALTNKMVEGSGLKNLDEAAIKLLVEKHGFNAMPIQEYPYIGLRITEMSNLFEMPEGRMLAQTAIFQEVMIRNCQKSIANLMRLNSDGKELSSKLDQLKELQKSYESTMEKLGATQEQNPSFRQRVAFNDSVGQITKAIQAYYGDKDNTIIDGVFTMSEVKLLLTPTTLRPIQYRPDLVLLSQDWKLHFWNTDYEALALPRDQHRRLMRAFEQAVQAQRSDDGEPVADMGESGEDILIEAEDALSAAQLAEKPGEDVGASMPDEAVMPQEAPRAGRGGRGGIGGGNDVVAI